MKPSEVIREIEEWIKTCGDESIYIISKIDGKGTHIGNIISVGADTDNGIIIETDIESISVTR